MNRPSRESRIASAVAWVLLLLSLGDWWSRVGANEHDYRELAFNADYLAWQTIIEDVVVRGNAFVGHWRLTPAPYWFPDAVLFAVARAVLPTIEARQYAVIVVQVVLLALALAWLARSVDAELDALGPALAAALVCLAATGFPPFAPVLLPTCHTGAATLAAFAVGALLRTERRRWWGPALGLVALLGSASDLLFTVFVAGALAALVASNVARLGPRGLWPHAAALAWVGGGCSAGWAVTRLLPFRAEIEEVLTPHALEPTLSVMANGLQTLDARAYWLTGAGLVALLIVALRGGTPGRRDLGRALLGGIVTTIGAIVVTGYAGGWQRYVAWPAEAALFGVLLLAPRAPSARVVALVAAAAALVFSALSAPPFAFPLEVPPSRWRAEAACVEALAKQEGARGIVTGYWQAKPLALFSSLPLQPAQFLYSVEGAYLWITTSTWYREPSGYALFVDTGLESTTLDREVPRRFVRRVCDRLTVRIYRGAERERLERFVAANQPP